MNKKGFTLIELLAVIIILGILMIIAIPSVTRYISDSRKSVYIDTAHSLISGARNLVNEGKLEMFDTDTTYYINAECIKTEGANKSPYGEFVKAYVVVTYDGKGYEYYWTSIDEVGNGVKNITRIDKLTEDKIESDLKMTDVVDTVGIDGRRHYMVINKGTSCGRGEVHNSSRIINGETGKEPVIYPNGKTRETVTTGDVAKIGTEEFYVVSNNGTNVVLLAKYNLKVGLITNISGNTLHEYTSEDSGYGIQSSEVLGSSGDIRRGSIKFSTSNYWENKVGTTYIGDYNPPDYLYVFDNNCILKQYIDNYKSYLESIGIIVKEARLLKISEAINLGCTFSKNSPYSSDNNCLNAPSFVSSTGYWLGSAYNYQSIFTISALNNKGLLVTGYGAYNGPGVRPVIVI